MRRALVASLLLAAAPPAWGYVRAKTDDGRPLYWQASCLPVTVYLNGFSMMTPDEVAKSIGAAAHAWSPTAVSCPGADGGVSHPYLEIVPGMAPAGAAVPPVAADGHNVVIFRTADWPYGGSVVALTTLLKKSDGRIVDADVEINADPVTQTTWANVDPGSTIRPGNNQPVPFDLQNALTHEMGHFIGLGHTCFAGVFGSDPVPPTDDQGTQVPDCGPSAPAEVISTVMYATIPPGGLETSKRFLSPDDIRAVCEIYPAENDPHVCALDLPDDGCGCATGGTSTRAAATALALLALLRTGRARPGRRGSTARRG